VSETCRILDCDRATIFTTDFATQELVLKVAEGANDIRVPLGQVRFISCDGGVADNTWILLRN
jgi:hypothetical protein